MNFIGPASLVSTAQDFSGAPMLGDVQDVVTHVIAGQTYVFASSFQEDGIQVMRLAGTTLVPVFSITDSTLMGLNGAERLAIATVGAQTFLVVTGYSDHALNLFAIDTVNPATLGHLVHRSSIFDNGNGGSETALWSVIGLETVQTAGGTYALAISNGDDAITVYRINANGTFTETDLILDADLPNLNLNGARAIDTISIGGRHFVYVGTDSSDRGISVLELSTAGVLTPVQDIDFGNGGFVESIHATTSGGIGYVIVPDSASSTLIVYRIGTDGALVEVGRQSYNDWASPPQHSRAIGLDSIVVNGTTFVTATDPYSDTLIVYGLDANGQLDELSQLVDATQLNGITQSHLFKLGGRIFVLAGAPAGDRLTLVEIGAQDDAIIGTALADRMVGLGGRDDLIGLAGFDTIFGGGGEDVLSGRAGNDALYGEAGEDALVGDTGDDLLSGGAGADLLMGGTGFDMIDYGSSLAAVTVDLGRLTAAGGDAAGDIYSGIEAIGGSEQADVLTGSAIANRLVGRGGADRLVGAAGNDTLDGGIGNDIVYAGAGNDQLLLGAGDDQGNGGDNNDFLSGGDGRDTLSGGNGADRLNGGLLDDSLTGGAGADVFVFQASSGDDVIVDFALAEDRIDIATIPGLNSLAEVQAAAFVFQGNTIIQLGAGVGTIQITGVLESQLTAGHFLF